MRNTRNADAINARCEKLEQLGFETAHNDSQVLVTVGRDKVIVDFSAVDPDLFLQHALQAVFEEGQRLGRNTVRSRFKELMTPERNAYE